jgi:Cdc6-like AAA superfamily ATPase
MIEIIDARALQTDAVPRDIVRRNAELDQMRTAFDPLEWGELPEHVRLFGPSGAGKTSLARYFLDRLEEHVFKIETKYVDCISNFSRWGILYEILDEITTTHDLHRQSTPTDELTRRLHEWDDAPYIVVLDEVDQVVTTDILDDLYRHPTITLVLIANEERQLLSGLDERLQSRIRNSVRTPLSPYSADELVAILKDRVRQGLALNGHDDHSIFSRPPRNEYDSDIISERQLERIADAAAGNARDAIGTLAKAARKARRDEADTISDEFVEWGIEQVQDEIRKPIEDFSPHHQELYTILDEVGEMSWGDLYDKYCERIENPKTKKTVKKYRAKLAYYNHLVEEEEGRQTLVQIQ